MNDLKSPEQYNSLFAKITKVVNEIDPCFYSGLDDEYETNVNHLLRLIRDHQINMDNFDQNLKLIFFGENVVETSESERLVKLSLLLKQELKDWL